MNGRVPENISWMSERTFLFGSKSNIRCLASFLISRNYYSVEAVANIYLKYKMM